MPTSSRMLDSVHLRTPHPRTLHPFLDGYCSTVQGLLDWFEVDLGFTELSFIQIDLCVLCVFAPHPRTLHPHTPKPPSNMHTHTHVGPINIQKKPIHSKKRPATIQEGPVNTQKRHINTQKIPCTYKKRRVDTQSKHAHVTLHST